MWYFGLVREGESYKQLRQRIAQTRRNLEQLPPDATVVVVSHAVFITMFMVHVCSDRPMNPLKALVTFVALFRIKNADMIEFIHTPIEKGCGWAKVRGTSTK